MGAALFAPAFWRRFAARGNDRAPERSGELVIHSTGPFTPGDVAAILRLGKPGWLLDAMLRHDTFAKQGREAFPRIPFLAPEGFTEVVDFPTELLIPAPAAWGDELKVLRLEGIPEHAGARRLSPFLAHLDRSGLAL